MHQQPQSPLQRFSDASDYLVQKIFGRKDFEISRLLLPNQAWKTFTPVFTNLVNVGSPVLTGRFYKSNGKVFVQVKIVPGTTSAVTAGTTYFDLPSPAGSEAIAGDGSMMDLTTLVAIGVCAFDLTNSRCYPPTRAATSDAMVISGWYEG